MNVHQKSVSLPPFKRGFHLITDLIETQMAQMPGITTGVMHVFIHHTSASLTINENADPTVRQDFETHFNTIAPENAPYYRHTLEGTDDMPAHLKASMLGSSISVPIGKGKLLFGTWQGVYLCEHRDHGGTRKITLTIMGI